MRAAAPEWPLRPEKGRLSQRRLPGQRLLERRLLERGPLEPRLLERCSEFQVRLRQNYRPTRCEHKRSERSGGVPIRDFRRSNVLRDVPYLTFFSVPLRLESEI
jgi:hypothetical protein